MAQGSPGPVGADERPGALRRDRAAPGTDRRHRRSKGGGAVRRHLVRPLAADEADHQQPLQHLYRSARHGDHLRDFGQLRSSATHAFRVARFVDHVRRTETGARGQPGRRRQKRSGDGRGSESGRGGRFLRIGQLEARADRARLLPRPGDHPGAHRLDLAARSGVGGVGAGRPAETRRIRLVAADRRSNVAPLDAGADAPPDRHQLGQVSAVDRRAGRGASGRRAGPGRAAQLQGGGNGGPLDRAAVERASAFWCRCHSANGRRLYRRCDGLVSVARAGADAFGAAGPLVAIGIRQRHEFCRLSQIVGRDRRHQENVRAVRPRGSLGDRLADLPAMPGRPEVGLGFRLPGRQSAIDRR